MIRLTGPVNQITAVAVSGGVDSMAALSFLRKGNRKIEAIYFDHGTAHGTDARKHVEDFCKNNNISLISGKIQDPKTSDQSWEEYWRVQRYAFLHSLKGHIIATAHHLNDLAETYLWGCANGQPRFIHYRQPGTDGKPTNIVRPFLLTTKADLLSWCERHSVSWIYDPSNEDTVHSRNRIRHIIMPEILKINPGFLSVVQRLWLVEEQRRNGHNENHSEIASIS